MGVVCRLVHADCLDAMGDVVDDHAAAAMICDLPFGLTRHGWDSPIDLEKLWATWRKKRQEGAPAACFANLHFLRRLTDSNPNEFRYELVWAKSRGSNPLVAKHRPVPAHEYLALFGKGKIFYASIKEASSRAARIRTQKSSALLYGVSRSERATCVSSDSSRHPLSVRHCAVDSSSRNGAPTNSNTQYHPTQKPIALLRWLMRAYVGATGCVVDPSSGGASTAVAALKEGLSAVCVEKDNVFFERGLERVQRVVAEHRLAAKVEVVR